MKILISFADLQFPFARASMEGVSYPSPLFSILQKDRFDKIILIYSNHVSEFSSQNAKSVRATLKNIKVDALDLNVKDLSCYSEVFEALRSHMRAIKEGYPSSDISILGSCGPDSVKASWLLLVASNTVEAKLIQVQPPSLAANQLDPQIRVLNLPQVGGAYKNFITQLSAKENGSLMLDDLRERMGLWGKDSDFLKVVESAYTLAQTNAPILIEGEQGTGKELLARMIHACSVRSHHKCHVINCAALSDSLAERFFLGFYGEDNSSKFEVGKLFEAHQSTLVLKNIEALSMPIQIKLLKMIDYGTIEYLGGNKPHEVNVRVIATTTLALERQTRSGLFHPELYKRFKEGLLYLKPLRDRTGDVDVIAIRLLDLINQLTDYDLSLSSDAINYLNENRWPGNIRELQSVVQRAALRVKDNVIHASDIDIPQVENSINVPTELPLLIKGFELDTYLSKLRCQIIEQALDESRGRQSDAARILGITPQAVHNFVKTKRKDLEDRNLIPRKKKRDQVSETETPSAEHDKN